MNCARRSPDEATEDPGSIPGTSTDDLWPTLLACWRKLAGSAVVMLGGRAPQAPHGAVGSDPAWSGSVRVASVVPTCSFYGRRGVAGADPAWSGSLGRRRSSFLPSCPLALLSSRFCGSGGCGSAWVGPGGSVVGGVWGGLRGLRLGGSLCLGSVLVVWCVWLPRHLGPGLPRSSVAAVVVGLSHRLLSGPVAANCRRIGLLGLLLCLLLVLLCVWWWLGGHSLCEAWWGSGWGFGWGGWWGAFYLVGFGGAAGSV